ncbi:hypothetical protein TRICI_004804 [Trichomonascus ciferrii]|uniref:DUS-like FMN-binding domain-containing protein n=1 Tax=Trichomonascus ciferrii TaxID=44093 RepID=A0A642UYI2_9ASCO|nr:hypothetical protein TRICI_004804 [Trichomonascus ciferrii]
MNCTRTWNAKLECVDFAEAENPRRIVFRTCPRLERGRLVFQMGTASPELAVRAGKVVAGDVDAIDVNSGCPMHFSMHSGMGAALLQTPDRLVDILTALVRDVGGPFGIHISVKIRLLDRDDPEPTYALVRRLVRTGISCLTLHCRTTPMRPREPVLRFAMRGVADICHAAGVACYLNGDVVGPHELRGLMDAHGVDGAMIARAAEANPTCFAATPQPWRQVAREYMQLCHQVDNSYINSKYCLAKFIPGKHPLHQSVARAKSLDAIQAALDQQLDLDDPPARKRRKSIDSFDSESKPKRQVTA